MGLCSNVYIQLWPLLGVRCNYFVYALCDLFGVCMECIILIFCYIGHWVWLQRVLCSAWCQIGPAADCQQHHQHSTSQKIASMSWQTIRQLSLLLVRNSILKSENVFERCLLFAVTECHRLSTIVHIHPCKIATSRAWSQAMQAASCQGRSLR